MLEKFLLEIIEKLNKPSISEKADKLLEYMKYYKINQYIYPGAVSREVGLDIKDVYILLESIANEKLLERNYEIYCHKCEKYQGDICKTISEAREKVCAHCGYDIEDIDMILIYKVVNANE